MGSADEMGKTEIFDPAWLLAEEVSKQEEEDEVFEKSSTDLIAPEALGFPCAEAPHFSLEVISEGSFKGRRWDSATQGKDRGERCEVGASAGCDFHLPIATISRHHVELIATSEGVELRDLGSTNGTIVDSIKLTKGVLRGEQHYIGIGGLWLLFKAARQKQKVSLWPEDRFGEAVGHSEPMRRLFAILDRFAQRASAVLLQGDTGTGKTLLAKAVHDRSSRSGGPFISVNCGAIVATLAESELFGHEKGAFTGAGKQKKGFFEAAHGGTLFLDEIGELDPGLQAKLLHVLESGQVTRVGNTEPISVDVRVLTATHRDLRKMVNEGHFREDLYYRLASLRVHIPPLSERSREDFRLIVGELLKKLEEEDPGSVSREDRERMTGDVYLDELMSFPWRGNVRELKAHLERDLVLQGLDVPLGPSTAGARGALRELLLLSKEEAMEGFEVMYLEALMRRNDGNAKRAAKAAQIDYSGLLKRIKQLRAQGKYRDS